MGKTIAIASGKGGVGKSTVTIHTALALNRTGKKIGILDADIYGPNIPLMLGIENSVAAVEDNKIIPVKHDGIEVMSVAFIVPPEKALIWRGPLANKLIDQFLTDIKWDDLDFLLIDLPPGTGDVPLSIIQKASLHGGIIVSTPQEASVADVKKMINMFQTTQTPILGYVENMTHMECPKCHHSIEMFPPSPVTINLVKKQIPELGRLPFNPIIGRRDSNGKPILNEDKKLSKYFDDIAEILLNQPN